jgi:hypothetical protein
MAEREGFEPSMELLTPYSLSRGAPSATRPSLLRYVPGYRPRYPALVRGRSPKSSRLDEVSPPATIALGPQPGGLGRALLIQHSEPSMRRLRRLLLLALSRAGWHISPSMCAGLPATLPCPHMRPLPLVGQIRPLIEGCRALPTLETAWS